MDPQLPLVSIISINYNYADATREMLDSAKANSYPNLEVIVVDNASTKSGFEKLPSLYPNFTFVKSENNLGFAGGNNYGASFAKGEYLFFLNNDAVITDGCLEKLVAVMQSDDSIGVVSPIIFNTKEKESDPDVVQYAGTTRVNPFSGRNKTIGEGDTFAERHIKTETAYAHGCAMMVSRNTVEKAGLIPEMFFLYYEELDWCQRIMDAGLKVKLVPDAHVYHHESLTIGADSPLKTYYINRSRILFMRRNSATLQLLGFFFFLIFFTIPKNSLKFILKGQWANLKAFWRAVGWNFKDMLSPSSKSTLHKSLILRQVS